MIRSCCGQEHAGVACSDYRVMCCLCFDRVPIEELVTVPGGGLENVCLPCRRDEDEELRRRRDGS